jgi:hypothetical protein
MSNTISALLRQTTSNSTSFYELIATYIDELEAKVGYLESELENFKQLTEKEIDDHK